MRSSARKEYVGWRYWHTQLDVTKQETWSSMTQIVVTYGEIERISIGLEGLPHTNTPICIFFTPFKVAVLRTLTFLSYKER